MNEVLQRIGELCVVPVVVINDADNSEPLAEALLTGSLPCAEVTFRTDAAAEVIKRISHYKNICLGAGTVLSIDQAKQALDAGARFIVTPGFNPKVVNYCVENNIPITPGVCNPTQIEMGLEYSLTIFKFFPAEAFGGLKTLKAISSPYNRVKFIPTGGINSSNLSAYLSLDNVFACGGSWLVNSHLIAEHKFDQIIKLVKEAVDVAKNFNPS